MTKKPTAAQLKVLEAVSGGDHLLFFVDTRELAKMNCLRCGWIARDDLGNYTLTDSGRSILMKEKDANP